jgi:hypothetical protein
METGDRNFDTVAFYVKDFGEVLLASVRRIPRIALDNMAKDDPGVVVTNLADVFGGLAVPEVPAFDKR